MTIFRFIMRPQGNVRLHAAVVAALGLAFASTSPVSAQAPRSDTSVTNHQRCVVIPDTARAPSAGQIADMAALHDTLNAIGRRHGLAEPIGILFVLVDSTRHGRILVLDSNFQDPALADVTRAMTRYLGPLEPGRKLQMLVRVDGPYPALAPGKEHCMPDVRNDDRLHEMMSTVMERDPDTGKPGHAGTRRALLRLVVNRTGAVAFVDVEQPTGDAFIDQYLVEMGKRLTFYPARLNGVPFDSRIRYTLSFQTK
jgi:TonB family protein